MSQSFSKSCRLLRPADYLHLKSDAKRADSQLLRLYFKKSKLNSQDTRIGLVVSKKVGNAVNRNLVKRVVRDFFRTSDFKSTGMDILVIASPRIFVKKSKDEAKQALRLSLASAFKRFKSEINI